jgi:hypothetical protein
MTPVLIYTDTKRIADEQAVLDNAVTLYQAVYNAIKAIGIQPTIAEIDNLVNLAKRQSTTDYVKDYVTNKVLDAATSFVVNGVTFTRNAFKSFMALPDYSGITTALMPSFALFNNNASDIKAINPALLSLTADVISKVSDADTQITNLYTYYTKTDASSAVATGLQTVCDALNTFDSGNNDFFSKKHQVLR